MTQYKRPIVAVDVVIFTVINNELQVLLMKRERKPYQNELALIGAFTKINETTVDAANRALKEKADVDYMYLEQLYTFDAIKRDPRDRVITVSYFTIVKNTELKSNPATTTLVNVKDVGTLAFDHNEILMYAIQRLQWKFEYTTIPFAMLPELFTLRELQELYETVLEQHFNKSNFRKRILKLNILEKTEHKETTTPHRPAYYYRFIGRVGKIVHIF